MPLQRIASELKSVYVAEQLLKEIQSGGYGPGDRIPTEEEIALQTGVSRTAVREAMAALRLAGIVESRAGAGTFVRQATVGTTGSRAISILQEQASPSEMIGARKAIEEGITILAAQQAEPADLDRLDAIVRQMETAAAARDYDRYLQMNKQFHLAIARATHNRAVVQTIEGLLQYMDEPLWQQFRIDYYDTTPARLRPAVQLHARLARAVRTRNIRGITTLLRLHFDQLGQMKGEGGPFSKRAPTSTARRAARTQIIEDIRSRRESPSR